MPEPEPQAVGHPLQTLVPLEDSFFYSHLLWRSFSFPSSLRSVGSPIVVRQPSCPPLRGVPWPAAGLILLEVIRYARL